MEGRRKSPLLKHLHITPPSTSAAEQQDFDFDDVFESGPSASAAPTPSSSAAAPPHLLPEVIHARSHSFVGPSPRYPHSPSPFSVEIPVDEEEEDEEEEDEEEGERGGSSKMGPWDFEMVRVVGQGAFGKVFLVRRRRSAPPEAGEAFFAMKVMGKETVIRKNHVEYMRAERDILTKITHPFIVQLRYSFQTKTKLYLIFDFINGGHLFFQLYRQGLFSEDQARMYAAEIVSAVSHLHKNGIVHRDLKPENILMDAEGHVMLTDFGLAKEIDESSRSNSLCGTLEYMAPEIILAKGHNKEADWWSVGILIFEMLTGQPPFTHSNRQKLQQRIIKEKVKLPSYLSSDAHSLLKGLLRKEPATRLGSGPNGEEDIKKSKWFRSIDWKKLERREMQPMFKPEVSGRACTANFDKCWTSIPPVDSPAPTPTSGEYFHGFSYVATPRFSDKP